MYCSTKSYTNLLASIVEMQHVTPLDKMQANQILNYAMQVNSDHKINKVLEHRTQFGLKGFDNESIPLKHQIINDNVLVNLKRERSAINEVNSLVQETAISFMENPKLDQINDAALSKTLQCIKNLACERSVKIDFVRSMKDSILKFVPDESKNQIEKQIVSKQRELDRNTTNTRKVVLESTVENSFTSNP